LKQASKQVVSNAVKEETKSIVDDEDSEDDKPLSSRIKGSTNNVNKVVTAPAHVKDEPSDDDEVPLSSRFAMKSNAGTSSSKSIRSSEIRPFPSKSQLNGSTKNDKQQKSSVVPTKRPMDNKVPSNHSSAKKPKLLDACTTTKVKQVTVKVEQKADDDDHLTISQRMKKADSSANKSSFAKKKVTKVVSSSLKKTTQKNKKQMKNSKYSKSTKVQPGSSDGQKKWTTLVHNGVIFPPPYKPHGVKILYKGKPIDLTPEQEEV
jgi:DNA topoisomerase-1